MRSKTLVNIRGEFQKRSIKCDRMSIKKFVVMEFAFNIPKKEYQQEGMFGKPHN